jgi:hypothetical protein
MNETHGFQRDPGAGAALPERCAANLRARGLCAFGVRLIEIDGEIIAAPALGGFYQKNVSHVEQCFGALRR